MSKMWPVEKMIHTGVAVLGSAAEQQREREREREKTHNGRLGSILRVGKTAHLFIQTTGITVSC